MRMYFMAEAVLTSFQRRIQTALCILKHSLKGKGQMYALNSTVFCDMRNAQS